MRYIKRKEIFWKKMRYFKRNEIHKKKWDTWKKWLTDWRYLERLDILWEALNILEETRYFERLEIL